MSKVILGGGLSGLSAAFYASNKFPKEVITILEKSNRVGGWLKSTRQDDGTVFEQAARTIRPKGEAAINTLKLINELGLNDEIVPVSSSSPAAVNRMIYANGKLHNLPNSIAGILKKQEPFSKPLFMFLLADVFSTKKHKIEDESLYSFVNRKFGTEVADYLISPLVCGICGGDAREISVKFLMKSFFEKEQTYGNITFGIIADLFKKKEVNKSALTHVEHRAKNEKWNVFSFKNGIQSLPDAINKNIIQKGVNLKFNEHFQEIEVYKKSVVVHTQQGTVHFGNHLISSIPALNLGPLLKKHHPYLTDLLSNFKTASMCVVNLKYNNKRLLDKEGFGFLVAPKENVPLLGVIYDSCCFPNQDSTILTAMMGGFKFDKYFSLKTTDEEVLSIALKQIKDILNITDKPDIFKVNILHNCIPQYVVGHYKIMNQIEDYLQTNNLALSLCGASYYGVGVNDVILSAKKAIDDI